MEIKGVYRQGAEDGVLFGIMLSAVSLAFIYSAHSVAVSYLAILLLLAVPVVLYMLLHRYYVKSDGFAEFSAIWMLGILISLFGSLICGVVTYVWLQYLEPTFIYDQVKAAIDVYESIPEMRDSDMVVGMKRAIEEGLLPSPIELVVNMIMLTTFIGSLLSVIISLIVRSFKPKNK